MQIADPRPQTPRASLKDVAMRANVGKSTASLALRDDPRIRPETRARIKQVASDIGYRPEPLVASLMCRLRLVKSARISTTLAYLDGACSGEVGSAPAGTAACVSALANRAESLGYGLERFPLDASAGGLRHLLRALRARDIAGLIVGNLPGAGPVSQAIDILWAEFPAVELSSRSRQPPLDCVGADPYGAIWRAVREVSAAGYRQPGLAIDPDLDRAMDGRYSSAYSAACRSPLVPIPVHSYRPGHRAAFARWVGHHRPDVILTCHMDVRRWLSELQLRAPEDIGFVHCDLGPDAGDCTGMCQNHAQIGAAAAELLAGRIERNERGIPAIPVSLLIQPTWVRGATIRRVKRVPASSPC